MNIKFAKILPLIIIFTSCSQEIYSSNVLDYQNINNNVNSFSNNKENVILNNFSPNAALGKAWIYTGYGKLNNKKLGAIIIKSNIADPVNPNKLNNFDIKFITLNGEESFDTFEGNLFLEKLHESLLRNFSILYNVNELKKQYFLNCDNKNCTKIIDTPLGKFGTQQILQKTSILKKDVVEQPCPFEPCPDTSFLIEKPEDYDILLNINKDIGLVSVDIPKLKSGFIIEKFAKGNESLSNFFNLMTKKATKK